MNFFVGSPIDNVQKLISIRNNVTSDVVWFNEERVKKPQQFVNAVKKDAVQAASGNNNSCDFCSWGSMTAQDTFGRIEGRHCFTASNLFKYVAPYQAINVFKHHDPLEFSLDALCDLLDTSGSWFEACSMDSTSKGGDPRTLHPLILWNCNVRSGASQYHGHAQLLFSSLPFTYQQVLDRNILKSYSGNYYEDFIEAHREVYLSRDLGMNTCISSVAPFKDRELYIFGKSIQDKDFQRLVHCGLRCVIDLLGTSSFNVGIYPQNSNESSLNSGVVCRIVSRGRQESKSIASDWGGTSCITSKTALCNQTTNFAPCWLQVWKYSQGSPLATLIHSQL